MLSIIKLNTPLNSVINVTTFMTQHLNGIQFILLMALDGHRWWRLAYSISEKCNHIYEHIGDKNITTFLSNNFSIPHWIIITFIAPSGPGWRRLVISIQFRIESIFGFRPLCSYLVQFMIKFIEFIFGFIYDKVYWVHIWSSIFIHFN